jgi:hypothetical protein
MSASSYPISRRSPVPRGLLARVARRSAISDMPQKRTGTSRRVHSAAEPIKRLEGRGEST